jgi:hypothetical protein
MVSSPGWSSWTVPHPENATLEAGRTSRVAEIFPGRDAALADRAWREQQVRAYAHFLRSLRQPVPRYSVAPIRRGDLPRSWRPLPALGFLRGQFV